MRRREAVQELQGVERQHDTAAATLQLEPTHVALVPLHCHAGGISLGLCPSEHGSASVEPVGRYAGLGERGATRPLRCSHAMADEVMLKCTL
jgi:hypothetical protein